jgi:hypothetical protein
LNDADSESIRVEWKVWLQDYEGFIEHEQLPQEEGHPSLNESDVVRLEVPYLEELLSQSYFSPEQVKDYQRCHSKCISQMVQSVNRIVCSQVNVHRDIIHYRITLILWNYNLDPFVLGSICIVSIE